jgi:hypothetical protein
VGDSTADTILAALRGTEDGLLTRTQIRDLFGRNRSTADISRALTLLAEHGKACRSEDRSGGGRPVEQWSLL